MKQLALIAILLAFLALPACSSSDDTEESAEEPQQTTSESPQVTKAEFASEMDALCKEADDSVAQAEKDYDAARKRGDDEASIQVLEDALEESQKYTEILEQLPAPASEAEFKATYLDYVKQSHTFSASVLAAVKRGDVTAANNFIEEGKRVVERREALVAGHGGFEHCGDKGEAP